MYWAASVADAMSVGREWETDRDFNALLESSGGSRFRIQPELLKPLSLDAVDESSLSLLFDAGAHAIEDLCASQNSRQTTHHWQLCRRHKLLPEPH